MLTPSQFIRRRSDSVLFVLSTDMLIPRDLTANELECLKVTAALMEETVPQPPAELSLVPDEPKGAA